MASSMDNGDLMDPVWDHFKQKMRTLYLDENRSLKEVSSEMATNYEFVAT